MAYNAFGYGYNPYGNNGGYGVYGPPVIIVGGTQTPTTHGRMVKGQGYRSDPAAAAARGATSGSPAANPSSSSGTSTSTSTSNSGASSSNTRPAAPTSGRTAQPKP